MKSASQHPGSNMEQEKAPVLVISSHVMTGAVGNRAAGFVLERQGHPVWEVPTIILPWHPGHGPSSRQTIDSKLFAQNLDELTKHPDFARLGAIMTGYIGSLEQVPAMVGLIRKLKAANPQAIYLCDPVMGEERGLYVDERIAEAIRDQLLPLADIITPNRYEFGWMTNGQAEGNSELVNAAPTLGRPTTIITSAFALMRNAMANLLIDLDGSGKVRAIMCEHPAVPNPPSGTGDMFSALYLAQKLQGASDELALKQASSGVFELVARSAGQGYRDLEVARFGDRFVHPMAMVNMRQIATA